MKLGLFNTALTAVLALAATVQPAEAARFTVRSAGQTLTANDQLVSPNGRVTAQISPAGFFEMSHVSFPMRATMFNGVSTAVLRTDGRLEFKDSAGATLGFLGGTKSVDNGVTMVITDDGEIQIKSSSGAVINNRSKTPGFEYGMIRTYGSMTNANAVIGNSGQSSNVQFYLMDSGVSSNWDPSEALAGVSGITHATPTDPTGTSTADDRGDGTRVATILKGKYLGLARGAGLTSIKINRPGTDLVSERSIVSAFKFAAEQAMPTGRNTKMVILNAVMRPFSNVVSCAIQRAFSSGIYVIQAAGNDNTRLSVRDDRVFTVGAMENFSGDVDGSIAGGKFSSFKDDLDIWAPGQWAENAVTSTGYAAAQVAAVMAKAISAWPSQLAANPNRGYHYVRNVARTDILSSSHFKVANGNNKASNAFIRDSFGSAPGTTTYTSTAPDFCTAAGLGANPTWTAIQNLASTSYFGRLVSAKDAELKGTIELPIAGQRQYVENYGTNNSPCELGDQVASRDGEGTLTIESNGDVVYRWMSIPVARWACPGATAFEINDSGIWRAFNPSTTTSCNLSTNAASTSPKFTLTISNNHGLTITNDAGSVRWTYTVPTNFLSDWPQAKMTGQPTGEYAVSSANGAGVKIYLLDSGINTAQDPSGSLKGRYVDGPAYDAPDTVDYQTHGTRLALLLKSEFSGMAQSANLVNVKITRGNTRDVSEATLVKAFQWVDGDSFGTDLVKIINLSVGFNPMTDRVRCALQWAYHKKIAVVMAAGNDNLSQSTNIKYTLTIGSVTWNPAAPATLAWASAFSNFGADIDLWAPAQYLETANEGTSIATAYATAALAAAVTRWPSLTTAAVGVSYNYLISRAVTNFVSSSSKTTGSTASNKFLNWDFTASPNLSTNYVSNPTNFCGNLGHSATVPNWNALLTQATTTLTGGLVNNSNGKTRGATTTFTPPPSAP